MAQLGHSGLIIVDGNMDIQQSNGHTFAARLYLHSVQQEKFALTFFVAVTTACNATSGDKHATTSVLVLQVQGITQLNMAIDVSIWILASEGTRPSADTMMTTLGSTCFLRKFFRCTRSWGLVNGLAQDCSNSIANALELLQSCTKPSICTSRLLTKIQVKIHVSEKWFPKLGSVLTGS